MISRRHWLAAIAGALSLSAMAMGCEDKTTKTEAKPEGSGATAPSGAVTEWKVGAYFSFSGSETQFGTEAKEGIELALDEINKGGGPKGKPMKIIFEDDKSNPQEATNKVLQLIDRDKVIALLGEVASSRSRAGGIVANSKKVPMISPSSTNPDVTKVGPFVFRVCFTDDVQGQMGAQFIINTLGKKKLGILYASDDLYSSGLAKEFREEAKRMGADIVLEKSFLRSETNYTTYLTELRDAKPDIIYAPIYYNAMVPIARQAKAANMPGTMFVGGDGWDATELLNDAGDEMEGAYFTNHYAPDVPWETSKAFRERYKERFHRDPTSLGAQAYDAAKLLADSISRAKGDTREAVRDAIQETKGFQGATGTINMNSERNAEKPVVIVQIKGKKFTYHSIVTKDGKGGAAPAPAPGDTAAPTSPSGTPAASPSGTPSATPSANPSATPSATPSAKPSATPSAKPAAPKK